MRPLLRRRPARRAPRSCWPAQASRRQQPPPRPQQPTESACHDHRRAAALPPKYAVPDFIALSHGRRNGRGGEDRSARCSGTTSKFEREFYLIPRDTYATIPPPRVHRPGAARSLARARRRRRGDRHGRGRTATACSSRCGWSRRRAGEVGLREGIQRRRLPTRASTRTRSPTRSTCAARAARRGAHEAGVHVRPRRRADQGTGRRSRHLEDLHLRLRRREPAARHRHAVARTSRPRGRPTAGRSRTRRTARGFPDIIVSYIYQGTHAAEAGRRQRQRSRTTCRPGRPTGRRSRSRRTATATPRSTS